MNKLVMSFALITLLCAPIFVGFCCDESNGVEYYESNRTFNKSLASAPINTPFSFPALNTGVKITFTEKPTWVFAEGKYVKGTAPAVGEYSIKGTVTREDVGYEAFDTTLVITQPDEILISYRSGYGSDLSRYGEYGYYEVVKRGMPYSLKASLYVGSNTYCEGVSYHFGSGTIKGTAGDVITPVENVLGHFATSSIWGKEIPFSGARIQFFDGGAHYKEVICDKNEAITLPSITKTGKVLKGWYTATTGGTRVGTAGDQWEPSDNASLYARWQDATVEITSSQGNKDMIVGDNFSYTVTTLPADATISISGCSWMSVAGKRISGNPSGAGDWTVTVTAAKPGHTSDTQTFTIHVVPRLSFTSAPSTGVIVNLGS